MVTLTDLSPERLVTKPMMVLRRLREPEMGVDMTGREEREEASGRGRGRGLLLEDGREPRDILAEDAQLMGLLHLAGLLAHPQLEELVAGFAELGADFGGGEFADFFRSHGRR